MGGRNGGYAGGVPLYTYGPLNGLSHHRINTRLLGDNGEDLRRVAGSLKLGMISASELVRSLLRSSRPTDPS